MFEDGNVIYVDLFLVETCSNECYLWDFPVCLFARR